MADINSVIETLSDDELELLNSDPEMLSQFKAKYSTPSKSKTQSALELAGNAAKGVFQQNPLVAGADAVGKTMEAMQTAGPAIPVSDDVRRVADALTVIPRTARGVGVGASNLEGINPLSPDPVALAKSLPRAAERTSAGMTPGFQPQGTREAAGAMLGEAAGYAPLAMVPGAPFVQGTLAAASLGAQQASETGSIRPVSLAAALTSPALIKAASNWIDNGVTKYDFQQAGKRVGEVPAPTSLAPFGPDAPPPVLPDLPPQPAPASVTRPVAPGMPEAPVAPPKPTMALPEKPASNTQVAVERAAKTLTESLDGLHKKAAAELNLSKKMYGLDAPAVGRSSAQVQEAFEKLSGKPKYDPNSLFPDFDRQIAPKMTRQQRLRELVSLDADLADKINWANVGDEAEKVKLKLRNDIRAEIAKAPMGAKMLAKVKAYGDVMAIKNALGSQLTDPVQAPAVLAKIVRGDLRGALSGTGLEQLDTILKLEKKLGKDFLSEPRQAFKENQDYLNKVKENKTQYQTQKKDFAAKVSQDNKDYNAKLAARTETVRQQEAQVREQARAEKARFEAQAKNRGEVFSERERLKSEYEKSISKSQAEREKMLEKSLTAFEEAKETKAISDFTRSPITKFGAKFVPGGRALLEALDRLSSLRKVR